MLIEATSSDFESLLRGVGPRGLALVSDSLLAPPEVLRMLSNLADEIRPTFAPAAWMIVEHDEIVGLCSLVRKPEGSEICIGYGIAPSREGKGITSRAVEELVIWAKGDGRVSVVIAETSVNNVPSQRVLERNGFVRTGERTTEEDGDVIIWRRPVA
ncbi:hypothetical protein AKJ09_04940 [Labilithrix luteola]|uniref:N-acetyltransferase domain-containing protein n=1 Tax=Labilithrix luteola TaxID=1391654 RepID=A0A0K1PY32_9BACT|nr:GNAT family N-acetyltransferase [Labilithrix luteola]AKU98276.1 hypothetical protein AKJ09_04940 [Labilithrix luteola]